MPVDCRDEPKVVLTEHLSDEAVQWLSEQVHLVRQGHEDAAALRQEIADARGLVVRTYTQVDDALLEAAPHLQVVARAGVGLDNIDLDACRRRKIQVVYTPEANTQAVVEYTLGLILDAIRPRRELADYVTPPTFHRLRREQVGGQLNERV
ncbi:MAG: 3-phosphoglycerate dehydrogenase, partial [Phycisphaerae bacterium]|nr:3-phosphoglycerate dehydrogenase [Phycisphaerae bacterium]